VLDVQRAALCIMAASLRSGDPGGWALRDVLTALNAVVAAAGPGMMSQGDLLVSIISLYSMAERQHVAELSGQQGMALDVTVGQQQECWQGIDLTSSLPAVAAAPTVTQLVPHPAAVFHAVEKMGTHLPGLPPSCEAAQWVMINAGQMPAAAAVLLGRCMAAVLPAGFDAQLASQGQQQQQHQADEGGQEVVSQSASTALVDILRGAPAAQVVAVRLCRQRLDEQQLCQVIAWLSALTAARQAPAISSSSCQVPELSVWAGHSTGNSSHQLQELLMGPTGLLELLRRCLLQHSLSQHMQDISGGISSTPATTRNSCRLLLMTACARCLTAVLLASEAALAPSTTEQGATLQEMIQQQALEQVSPGSSLLGIHHFWLIWHSPQQTRLQIMSGSGLLPVQTTRCPVSVLVLAVRGTLLFIACMRVQCGLIAGGGVLYCSRPRLFVHHRL
jgi:hypothetical protein